MHRFSSFIAILVALFLADVVRADHICTNSPDEVFIGYSPGGNGVAPTPICRSAVGQSRPQSALPPLITVKQREVMEDRHGAVVFDAETGLYGMSFLSLGKEEAEQEARRKCLSGGGKRCDSYTSHVVNGCQTLATGRGQVLSRNGEEPGESVANALSACRSELGPDCRELETYCSHPYARLIDETPDDLAPTKH